jgi:hypothetical protein
MTEYIILTESSELRAILSIRTMQPKNFSCREMDAVRNLLKYINCYWQELQMKYYDLTCACADPMQDATHRLHHAAHPCTISHATERHRLRARRRHDGDMTSDRAEFLVAIAFHSCRCILWGNKEAISNVSSECCMASNSKVTVRSLTISLQAAPCDHDEMMCTRIAPLNAPRCNYCKPYHEVDYFFKNSQFIEFAVRALQTVRCRNVQHLSRLIPRPGAAMHLYDD